MALSGSGVGTGQEKKELMADANDGRHFCPPSLPLRFMAWTDAATASSGFLTQFSATPAPPGGPSRHVFSRRRLSRPGTARCSLPGPVVESRGLFERRWLAERSLRFLTGRSARNLGVSFVSLLFLSCLGVPSRTFVFVSKGLGPLKCTADSLAARWVFSVPGSVTLAVGRAGWRPALTVPHLYCLYSTGVSGPEV